MWVIQLINVINVLVTKRFTMIYIVTYLLSWKWVKKVSNQELSHMEVVTWLIQLKITWGTRQDQLYHIAELEAPVGGPSEDSVCVTQSQDSYFVERNCQGISL